jgi:hypothetical protein
VLIKKKDQTFRFCVDFRRLNRVTKADAYPLPRNDDVIATLTGSNLFTKFELASAYWQVNMSNDSKEKTAFVTSTGLYQITKIMLGLTNAPATFQRLMDTVLTRLNWKQCVVYLHDIIIFASTFEEHIQLLDNVLQRLQDAKRKIKIDKCHFLKRQVTFSVLK